MLTVTHRLHAAPELPARQRAARKGRAFKGAQPATRYEMASVVARALVTVDAEKASKQDLELLKKLVMEFKDELDALGVKVDSLDKRVAVLEDGIGGWKVRGTFWFDASFGDSDNGYNMYTGQGNDTEFNKQRFRLYLTKQIDENTSFYAELRAGENENDGWGRGDMYNARIRDMYVDTLLWNSVGFRVGRFTVDFEGDHGLYIDNEPIFGDYRIDGFQFTKQWNTVSAKAIIGRNIGGNGFRSWDNSDGIEYNSGAITDLAGFEGNFMNYALDLTWQPNEAFFLGVNGNWMVWDSDVPSNNAAFSGFGDDMDASTYSVYASYNFTPAIALQGIYYFQDLGDGWAAEFGNTNFEDSPQAWRATLDLKQDLLKFTSLRFEYMQLDNTFIGQNDPYNLGVDTGEVASIMNNWGEAGFDYDGTSKLFFIYAEQKWSEKWSSYLRYQQVDYDSANLDDAQGYGIGVTYQYTPAIAFRLAYDLVDYGNATGQKYQDEESVIQFRTVINF
ncbi:S-layer homology domain-containing protein [uncultured Cloacibacillus sp.]|uniref:S-layer homology domain-containing protein n=1 Tax=uncultured Cloacibacillus sp. TaxID=889794 RepID=UPI0032090FD0